MKHQARSPFRIAQACHQEVVHRYLEVVVADRACGLTFIGVAEVVSPREKSHMY